MVLVNYQYTENYLIHTLIIHAYVQLVDSYTYNNDKNPYIYKDDDVS